MKRNDSFIALLLLSALLIGPIYAPNVDDSEFLEFKGHNDVIKTAGIENYIEDFTSTTHRDSLNTNISDWGEGSVQLPIKSPILSDQNTTDSAFSICVSGNYLYVGYSTGLKIFDISIPGTLEFVGNYSTESMVYEIQVVGNTAYLANYYDGVILLNVTDKSDITYINAADFGGAVSDIEVVGNYLYHTRAASPFIRTIDITDPYNILDEGLTETSYTVGGVCVDENYLYVAVGAYGLDVFDISTPDTPTNRINIDLDGYPSDILVNGDYAYVVADLGGLSVVNISNLPSSLSLVTQIGDNTRYWDLYLDGDFIYIPATYSSYDFWTIYDVSDPDNPVFAGKYDLPNGAKDICVSGDYAYVPIINGGVEAFQIASSGQHFSTVFASSAVAQSHSISYCVAGQEVISATLIATQTLEPGTSIDYYMSVDGGSNWESVTNGVKHDFTSTGRYLEWRARLLTMDTSVTPKISQISIEYTTTILPALTLVSPLNDTILTDIITTFDWNDIGRDYNYNIQIANSSTFGAEAMIVNYTFYGAGEYTPSSALPDGKIFWRVAGIDYYDDIGEWSETRILTIDTFEPLISGPGNIEYVIGESGNSISWHVIEINLVSYTILLDDVDLTTETITIEGNNFLVPIDGLSLGEHNCTIIVEDIVGNIASESAIITVLKGSNVPKIIGLGYWMVIAGAGVAYVIIKKKKTQ